MKNKQFLGDTFENRQFRIFLLFLIYTVTEFFDARLHIFIIRYLQKDLYLLFAKLLLYEQSLSDSLCEKAISNRATKSTS